MLVCQVGPPPREWLHVLFDCSTITLRGGLITHEEETEPTYQWQTICRSCKAIIFLDGGSKHLSLNWYCNAMPATQRRAGKMLA